MSHPMRQVAVLLAACAGPYVCAEDKFPAKPADKKLADARQAALIRAGYTPVPLTLGPWGDLSLFVEGTVGSEKVRFELDSGCGETVLDLAVAKRLKLNLGEETTLVGLGKRWVGRSVVFPGLTLGPYNLRKDWNGLDGPAIDMSGFSSGKPTGLFGMPMLNTWGAVIDYPARTLYLRPPLLNAWPQLAGTWTVTSWQEEGQARKLDPKTPPAFAFASHHLKMTDSGQTREYAIHLVSGYDGVKMVILSDPKLDGKLDAVPLAWGLIKVAGGRMTACLCLDMKKAKEPPAEFAAPAGSGLVLLELKRTVPDTTTRKPTDPFRELLLKDGYTAVPMEIIPGSKRVVTAQAGQHSLRLAVDTGSSRSGFNPAGLDKWGAKRLGKTEVGGLAGGVKIEEVHLRGLTLGDYDTRHSWAVVHGGGFDLTGLNKALAEQKLRPIQGLLGNLDLLNGSAVIDFGTNTLYLKPVKATVCPQLEGKWVAVGYEFDGRKGQYNPGDASIEFKAGQVRFTTKGGTSEWGFHLRDEGDRYLVGLFNPKADELADDFKYSRHGLLKLAEGKLTLVIQQDAGKEPTEFAAPKGSGLLLVECKRAR